MTPDTPRPGTPAPHVPRQGKPARRWPDPGTPSGAVLYAVIAGLIVWIIISILSHVHIIISWHLSVTTVGLEPAPEELRSGSTAPLRPASPAPPVAACEEADGSGRDRRGEHQREIARPLVKNHANLDRVALSADAVTRR
jgi:hypothetical protein